MATYLQLCNKVLSALNEVQITNVAEGANTSLQDYVTKAVLFAVDNINQEEFEWPFNVSSQSQALTPGVQLYALPTGYQSIDWESFFLRPAELLSNINFTTDITSWTSISTGTGSSNHTVTGNGRLRLAGGASGVGAVEQSIVTVAGSTYRLFVRAFGGTITIKIGTTTGASNILSTATGTPNVGGWIFFDVPFVATSGTTFVGFSNSNNDNRDIDYASVGLDIDEVKLEYAELDRWARIAKVYDTGRSSNSFGIPSIIFPTQNDKFGVSPVPDGEYVVDYEFWQHPTAMSVSADTPAIPTRFQHIIIDRAIWYTYMFRENTDGALFYDKKYKAGIDAMRSELIRKPNRIVGRSYFSRSTSI